MPVDPRRLADSYSPAGMGKLWVPVLPKETLNSLSDEKLYKYVQARKKAEELALESPVAWGWKTPAWQKVLDNWKDYPIQVVLGGVRSGKSTLASRLCVWALGNIPEAEIRCYHVNTDRSQQDQQRFVWAALPEPLKNIPVKKSFSHSIQYNQRTGFTNDMLILPPLEGWTRGGRIDFGNYKQWESDNRVTEGFKAHLIWCDESVPMGFFETIIYRTADYHGRLLLTFTTLDGWTPLVQDILGKTKTLEYRYSTLLKRKLPVLQESLSRKGALIHYFWTEDNPWIDANVFRAMLDGRPQDEVLCRAYGIPTKAATAVFTKFDQTVNVVKHEDLPFIKNPQYKVTRYMAIDPGGSKNWFMLWVAIDQSNTWWVYREWPDRQTYGDWAEPGPTIEGKPGPAQRSLGFGIKDYVDMIRQVEAGEEIFERLIDPRMGNAQKQSSEEGATTIISDLDKYDITVIPAPGVEIENGIQLIKDLLAWDENKLRDSVNCPHVYVSDRCENFIHAMSEYTAKGGPTEAVKDPCDTLRYLVVSGARYFDNQDMAKDYGTAL